MARVRAWVLAFATVVAVQQLSCAAVSITAFGAVANVSTVEASWANSEAILAAFRAANASASDRTVLVPADNTFYIMAANVTHVHNVELVIDGTLIMNNNISAWPLSRVHSSLFAALQFRYTDGLTIRGGGTIVGQGYDWWWAVILQKISKRPKMVTMLEGQNTLIEGLTVRNSPGEHFALNDVLNLTVRGVTIHVDVVAQKHMLTSAGLVMHHPGSPFPIPTFPLNTDGIDPAGKDILIEDCYIENFDDAVAVKPMTKLGKFSTCTENVLVRNLHVTLGVGMSIGSVPPNENVNCIRNVTFDTVDFKYPIKAIYVKTNPGTVGSGIIDNITYKNIYADTPLWYPMWIGPQQQKQPGSAGTGCSFLYPVVDQCPTQPRVPITNIKLQNVTMKNGLTLPGVLLCNASKPCTGFEFQDVTNDGVFLVEKDYVCHNVAGLEAQGTVPAVNCTVTQ